MTTISNSDLKGFSNDNTNIDYISNDREIGSTNYLHENETSRKLYPQRNNRAKLNYRDLDRGMYEEIRQSMWAFGSSTLINKNNKSGENNTRYHDDDDIIDLSMDDDDNDEKSNDNRRLWCICRKPWDHSKLMLRCDSCSNWYHGNCIGVTKEQARTFEINGDQFICPSCRGISHPILKSARSMNESILIKRKHFDGISSSNNHQVRVNGILSKSISHDESRKRAKTDRIFQRDLLTESKIHCIVHDCNNLAKTDWVYCSSACIRRHINYTLEAIQQSKGMDNVDIPTSEDILLYESKSKKILEKNLVPKIEDLCTWINQHPSYELVKPSLQKSILLTTNQSTNLTQSFSTIGNTTKSKFSLKSIPSKQITNTKSISNKKNSIELKQQINNTADIRSKVPTALYDKILMRLEKNGEKDLIKYDIRTIVNKIEEEMFRVYGKVNNSYKNKFRSLLANISNMNNNFFYKKILSKELTAQQIVAMKSEDMLPPEEKEKRKDQFEKEVQMIINAEQQTAEEMVRCAKMKVTRQGFIDNDAHLSMVNLKEEKIKDNQSTNISEKTMEIKPIKSKSIEKNSKSIILDTNETSNAKLELENQITASILPDLPPPPAIKRIDSNESSYLSSQLPISEQSNPIFSAIDLDNDYIEPESPTGIDALIYDDDEDNDNDNDDDDDCINTSSYSSIENTECILPYQQIIRDDYNPSKIKNDTTSIYQSTPITRLPNHWHGVIHSPDTKIPCQSVHIYSENDYLIENIPEQLIILGRLRLGDLWDYIRDSLTVRDVLILTLTSSSLNTNDNEIFLQYVDTMRTSGRAAVINKCTNSSLIRDMYILAADTKDCPSNVLSSLFLPSIFESKQLFLVIIGSGKRMIKSINRSNENQLLNNLTYKPVPLQDSTIIRDPRLMKNRDPRLSKSSSINENLTPSTSQQQTSVQYSNEDLLKLISDSLERIRHSLTTDDIRPIVISTTELLKENKRDDLCAQFTDKLRFVMTERQSTQGNTSISTSTIIAGDNLIEENMDVDDDQDDKHKKQIITSSNFNSTSEFNDVDYRFLDQDIDHQMTTTIQATDHRKQRRKSRFSDLLLTDNDRVPIDRMLSNEEEKSTIVNTNFRTTSQSSDKHINSALNNKFRPIINSTNSFISSINTKDKLISNPIHFTFSKDSFRRYKSNTNNNNGYESSPKPIEDLIKQVQSSNDNWIKPSIRSLIMEQQKIKNRFSSNTNEWRSSSYNNYMTHYHDFDQPQE